LLGSGANKAQSNLTLQERQKQLLEEKTRQEAEQRKKQEAHYGHGTFWDGLGQKQNGSSAGASSGSGTLTPIPAPGSRTNTPGLSGTINKPFADLNAARISARPETENDILAGFNSAAPVDASSHFPPQHNFGSGRSTPVNLQAASISKGPSPASNNGGFDFDDDDDPFGLNKIAQKKAPFAAQPASNGDGDDDDILGMLAKPISEIPRPKPAAKPREPSPPSVSREPVADDDHPQSKAVSELVDMGFPADKSADALAQTDTGMNVQAAVGILLNQAHEAAKQKARGRQEPSQHEPLPERNQRSQKQGRPESTPSWMREEENATRSTSRKDNRSPAGEKDVTQYAQDIGSTLFKSANSLWKTSQKKVQRAVADLQAESDGGQPKWMRDALAQESASRGERQRPEQSRGGGGKAPQQDVTDEALMLESGGGRPQKPAKPSRSAQTQSPFPDEKPRMRTPVNNMYQDGASGQREIPQRPTQQPAHRPATKLSRQDVESQAAEIFVSSSRRRKPTPQPAESPSVPSEPLAQTRSPLKSTPIQSKNPFAPQKAKPTPPPTSSRASPAPVPTRPKAPPRQIPPTSSLALSSSSTHRQNGSEAFKRGDYSAAHTHYTSALQGLPTTHPITIIIYCNRALTNIKVGDPRAALSDADTALGTIGVSRGEGEKIPLGGTEGEKEMREFFGKALMRKAEALENMEKWSDAAKAWKEAVEAGFGGAISIQGRNRCEKAAGGGSSKPPSRPASRPVPAKKPPPPKPARSALSDLSGTPEPSSDGVAVRKLREANAAAEKADDEKFALTDKVDAMLITWKGTKSDNLRALLGSLDKVLWPEAGWTKVGMQDLVMANRVKIVYMKAIAKVHPDKVCSVLSFYLSAWCSPCFRARPLFCNGC
jgi:hypothetical protein